MSRAWTKAITLCSVGLVLLLTGIGALEFTNLDEAGQVGLCMLVVAALLWVTEAVPLFVTSLVVLLLSVAWLTPVLQNSGNAIEPDLFLGQFFSDITLLFLGGFVLSAALHKLLLDEWLARTILLRVGTRPPVLMLAIMVTTAVLSMWLSNTATAAMMLAIILPLLGRLPSTDSYRQAMLLSVPFAANIGGLGTPIGSPPNAIAMSYLSETGSGPSFAMWMLISIPGVFFMLAICWCVLMFFFRGSSARLEIDTSPVRLRVNRKLLIVALTGAVTVVGWVTSSFHSWTPGTVAMLPVLVFFSFGILSVKDLRSLSWDALLLLGGGLCLGTALQASGLAQRIVTMLPVEGYGVYGLMVVFGSVACVMSSVMSNTATANLMMPIALGLNVEPTNPLLIGIAFACTLAMPLPVSTPPNAMAFASEQITVSDMVRSGLLVTFIGIVLAFTTGYWWWGFVGLW
ncbi:MAG TPA: hypothetical protein DDW52_00825 [Planctomycetaceae bacterium]|nr:hypothetical protein [Planctomycetaceae bacterium]